MGASTLLRILAVIGSSLVVVATAAAPGHAGMSHPADTPTCFGQPATIVGTEGNDSLLGGPGVDVIVGLGGADRIKGRGGNDLICGGAGNDFIYGGGGNDQIDAGDDGGPIHGGPGKDVLLGGAGRDGLWGDQGNDTIDGGNDEDEVLYAIPSTCSVTVDLAAGTSSSTCDGSDAIINVEDVDAGAGDDIIRGDDGPNRLIGDTGANLIYGRGGDDYLDGGAFANGGPGYDTCEYFQRIKNCEATAAGT
jgi:Ca2+-binding RTX toxin-like protein